MKSVTPTVLWQPRGRFLQFPLARWDRSVVHFAVCSNLRFANASAANCLVNSVAESSRPRRAAWPDQNEVKSADPAISDFARRGASGAAASGNSGAASDIGPTSRMKRFTIARAGRPVNTFVIEVALSLV